MTYPEIREFVKTIDNGSDVPGTVMEDCSPEFVKSFAAADLIVSKGQGNFETLSESDRNIFFLLKAKCEVVATHIGCELGSYVVGRWEDLIENRSG